MASYAFTQQAAEAIVEHVREARRRSTNLVGEQRPSTPQEASFWAYLSSPGGFNGLFWSWVRVQPVLELPTAANPLTMDDPPLWTMGEPHVAGYQNAREANDNRQVPRGTVVKLEFLGYGSDGEPQFVFQYTQQPQQATGVPIHDHRDNLQGGMAFSVWHPGTQLPQAPFQP
ncbi:MAG: hypothetical protein ACM359_00560 [Bacillota bacterium]